VVIACQNPEVQVTRPGWRAWQTVEDELVARKGGLGFAGQVAEG